MLSGDPRETYTHEPLLGDGVDDLGGHDIETLHRPGHERQGRQPIQARAARLATTRGAGSARET